jgi:hypothetical protein
LVRLLVSRSISNNNFRRMDAAKETRPISRSRFRKQIASR